MYLSNIGMAQQTRFERLGDLSDLKNAILNKAKAVQLTNDGHPQKPGHLSNLSIAQQTLFECLGDLSDLENAISNNEKAVQLTDDGHPQKPAYLSNLGNAQQIHFEHLGDLSNLENAILNHKKAVHLTDDDDPNKARHLFFLGTSHNICFQQDGHSGNLAPCIASFREAAHLKTTYPSHAFRAARQWAQISHVNGDLLSALDGYHLALVLLGKVAWLGLNTSSRQDQLLHEQSESLGCLAANCAINLGRFEDAVQLLDLGRSIFWQQASSLRSDFQKLREVAPELGRELGRVGHLLDAGIFSDTAFTMGQHINQHRAEEIVKEHRRLVGEWERLVESVRQLPLFKYFLQPIPFH
jgi:tetratricopeptide (TPR) repeat protein